MKEKSNYSFKIITRGQSWLGENLIGVHNIEIIKESKNSMWF